MSSATPSTAKATMTPSADASVSKATTTTIGTSTSGKSADGSELKILDEEVSLNDIVNGTDPDLTQPLRIGTTQMMFEARLTGSSSNLQTRENVLLRRKETVSSRSGSESPYYRGNSSYTFDGGSSISSLEDQGIDTDILTDKMGVLELNLKAQQEITQSLHKSLSNLPAVNERLRDETLEDCHAFTDLKREGTLSRGGSITTGGEVALEPLEEIDDEGDSNERTSKIKITNLAEILEAPDEEEIGETNAHIGTTTNPCG
mmetsp:Transcript_15674/g.32206  ORF Transcript_15674/g.32206 Transcript_15674/m.32206 type:complete len:260 (+) Transcript_15674:217-996(+)|eukprot:CAMPEP_0201231092 /NCGR_PEP_ID=MMETSP0852-20130820/2733_1 /ASSEMBLY_ACC=CAM_ASM_000632 /TAXON_ID=183588 /ORGANISM="Pseudo-nitzschia fraudulenta, Strain WWA7" /LENGTH=259 /DNA_ID=CAMNT_0047522549 /DNA_START=122 /DNA_END=901 /DNA_ORIENTATION=+